jgi:hypothetical protein
MWPARWRSCSDVYSARPTGTATASKSTESVDSGLPRAVPDRRSIIHTGRVGCAFTRNRAAEQYTRTWWSNQPKSGTHLVKEPDKIQWSMADSYRRPLACRAVLGGNVGVIRSERNASDRNRTDALQQRSKHKRWACRWRSSAGRASS